MSESQSDDSDPLDDHENTGSLPEPPASRGKKRASATAFAFSVPIQVPSLSTISDGVSDPIDALDDLEVVQRALTQLLDEATGEQPKGVMTIVAQFNRSELGQQTLVSSAVAVTGYVQLQKSTRLGSMENWLPACSWEMVPGGLSGNNLFKTYKARTDPWITFDVVGAIGLNNAGRRELAEKVQAIPPWSNEGSWF